MKETDNLVDMIIAYLNAYIYLQSIITYSYLDMIDTSIAVGGKGNQT